MATSPTEIVLENAFLREQLAKRMRLVWASMLFGVIVGLVLAAIFSIAPVSFGPEVWS